MSGAAGRIGSGATAAACLLAAVLLALAAGPPPAAGSPSAKALAGIERLVASGRYADAVDALQTLDGADRKADPLADYLLGFSLLQLYRFEESEAALRRAVAARPEHHAWLQALAKALLEQGRNLAAIEILDRALALEPAPDYHFARAMCALNVGDLEGAERGLRACLARDPRHAEALYKLGRILADRGDFAASLEPVERCLALRPEHLEARFLLGLGASKTGDLEAARRAFETVLASVPGHVGALYNLSRVLIQLGRREEGVARLEAFRDMSELRDRIDFYAKAVKKNPENLPGRLELARMLLEAGRTEDAVRELLAARQIGPRSPEVYRLLAAAFRRLGRDGDAERAEEYARRLAAEESG